MRLRGRSTRGLGQKPQLLVQEARKEANSPARIHRSKLISCRLRRSACIAADLSWPETLQDQALGKLLAWGRAHSHKRVTFVKGIGGRCRACPILTASLPQAFPLGLPFCSWGLAGERRA